MECVGKKKVKKIEERKKAHKDNDSKSPDSAIWCLLLSIFQLGYKLKKKKKKTCRQILFHIILIYNPANSFLHLASWLSCMSPPDSHLITLHSALCPGRWMHRLSQQVPSGRIWLLYEFSQCQNIGRQEKKEVGLSVSLFVSCTIDWYPSTYSLKSCWVIPPSSLCLSLSLSLGFCPPLSQILALTLVFFLFLSLQA